MEKLISFTVPELIYERFNEVKDKYKNELFHELNLTELTSLLARLMMDYTEALDPLVKEYMELQAKLVKKPHHLY